MQILCNYYTGCTHLFQWQGRRWRAHSSSHIYAALWPHRLWASEDCLGSPREWCVCNAVLLHLWPPTVWLQFGLSITKLSMVFFQCLSRITKKIQYLSCWLWWWMPAIQHSRDNGWWIMHIWTPKQKSLPIYPRSYTNSKAVLFSSVLAWYFSYIEMFSDNFCLCVWEEARAPVKKPCMQGRNILSHIDGTEYLSTLAEPPSHNPESTLTQNWEGSFATFV